MDGTLSWPLEHAATVYAERTASIDGERRVSYREIARRTGALGAALTALDCPPGSRIGVLAENSPAHLECWLTVPAHGRVLNDLNTRLAVPELAYMVEDCETIALFTDTSQLEVARELRERCDCLRHLIHMGPGPAPEDCLSQAALACGRPAAPAALDGAELAVISYTGGTTGRPKGVMLSHASVIANAKHNAWYAGFGPQDVYLHAAPMFHIADASTIFAVTWAGGAHAFVPRFDPLGVSAAIEAHGVTILVLVPTMIQRWLAALREHPIDLGTVRLLIYAGSPIAPETQRQALELLPFELLQGYGMTEASPSLTYLTDDDHRRGAAGEEPARRRLASVGPPLHGVQISVRDGAGEPVEPGTIGEVFARGPNIMLGYWNAPEATAAALRDGWYRTGDAGYVDEGGYLFLVDRIKDMIVTGGENVYSVEVEHALMSHPEIVEATVFGIPDADWGEAVHAVVVAHATSGLSERDVVDHCRALIAGFKLPRSVEIRATALPKSGAGKILKHELRAPHWAGHDGRVSGS